MSTTSSSITFDQFERLDLPKGHIWELHRGELVELPPPSFLHKLIQKRLEKLLEPLFKGRAIILQEMAYSRKDARDDYRLADLGVLAIHREPERRERIVYGAPEFVIEVLSPSNTVTEMNERKTVCAQEGGELFWIVDPDQLEVTAVDLKDPRIERKYVGEATVPIRVLGVETELSVQAIFDEICLDRAD